ncbi:MAG: hypothetical protein HWN81_13150 [Candidatus Lokiarchaeota archaeon]|nr:hypothetical protein [Candidatus Lokiarchaeota archaeon]
MESKDTITKEAGYNPNLFKVMYFIIYSFLIVFDIIFLFLFMTVWARLEAPYVGAAHFPGLFLLYVTLLILKICFESYEIVRIIIFLVWSEQDKESAIKVAEGFFGFKIFRMHYIVFIMLFLVWMEFGQTVLMFRDITYGDVQYEFFRFYSWFQVFLFIHIYSLEIVPRLMLLFADSTNKSNRMRAIRNMIVWMFVLLFILNFNFIIYFYGNFIRGIRS